MALCFPGMLRQIADFQILPYCPQAADTPVTLGGCKPDGTAWPSTAQRQLEKFALADSPQVLGFVLGTSCDLANLGTGAANDILKDWALDLDYVSKKLETDFHSYLRRPMH